MVDQVTVSVLDLAPLVGDSVAPETIKFGQVHKFFRIPAPAEVLTDSLYTCLRYRPPVAVILSARMKKFLDGSRYELRIAGIHQKAAHTGLDDLEGSPESGSEGGKTRRHGLEYGQTEGLEKSRLNKYAAVVGDDAVNFPGVQLVDTREPAYLRVKAETVDEIMRLFYLRSLLTVRGVFKVDGSRGEDEVARTLQLFTRSERLDEPGDIFDLV